MFAAAITDWASLVQVCNQNGVTLNQTETEAGINFISYNRQDSDGDGEEDTYVLVIRVPAVPPTMDGSTIVVSPEGIFKQTTS